MFLAGTPHPDFTIGPLFVSAAVPREHETVQVNVSWSLSLPAGRTPRPQPLYLLWPREVAAATAPGAPDPELARYVEARGLQVTGGGLLTMRARDRSRIGTGNVGEPLDVTASYVTFTRPGAPQVGTGTYVKIPWTTKLADPLAMVTLGLPSRA